MSPRNKRGKPHAFPRPLRSHAQVADPEGRCGKGPSHGGHVLKLLDQVAYACASPYAKGYAVMRGHCQIDVTSSPIGLPENDLIDRQVTEKSPRTRGAIDPCVALGVNTCLKCGCALADCCLRVSNQAMAFVRH